MIFDGVVGDCFKRNLWEEGPVKMYLRKGVVKEIKRLLTDFQIALFFISGEIKPRKILKYLESKEVIFDAVYKSRNFSKYLHSRKTSKNPIKRPLKYTEFIQNFDQAFIDFGFQTTSSQKVLILTSISLSPEDFESTGENLIFHSTSQYLTSYLW